jgi:hypothetical protein
MVCRGCVEVVGLKLMTHHPVIEPVCARAGNGNFQHRDRPLGSRLYTCQRRIWRRSRSEKAPISAGLPGISPERYGLRSVKVGAPGLKAETR